MAVPTKANMTASTAWRNRQWPHADRRIVALPCCEQEADTEVANVGAMDLNNAAMSDLTFDGTIAGTLTDNGGDDPFIDFTSNAAANRTAALGTIDLFSIGSDVDWPEITIAIEFKSIAAQPASTAAFIWHRGGANSLPGHVHIARSVTSNNLAIFYRLLDGTTNATLTIPIADWTIWHRVVLTRGPRYGLKVYVDNHEVAAQHANTEGVRFLASTVCRLGTNQSNANPGQFDYRSVVMDDREWSVEDVRAFMADPAGPMRPYPDADDQFATHTPDVGIPTTTGVSVGMTTGHGPLVFTDALRWKLEYGEDPYDLDLSIESDDVTDAADSNTLLEIAITGLDPDTTYFYRTLYTDDDGATWNPGPCELGSFHTDPGRDGTVTGVFTSDRHLTNSNGGGAPDLVDVGYGADEFRQAGSARRKCTAAYFGDLDILRVTKPQILIDGGDNMMLDAADVAASGFTNAAMYVLAATTRNSDARLSLAGIRARVKGNHEADGGVNCRGDEGDLGPCQAQATIAWKRYTLNPSDPAVSENEGTPTLTNDLSWVPPLNFDAGDAILGAPWRSGFVCDPAGENGSPLRNFFKMSYGPCDFFVADSSRYSNIGDPQGTRYDSAQVGCHGRNGPYWDLGEYQWRKLEEWMAASDAPHKILCIHNLFGPYPWGISEADPGEFYGRESGRRIKSTPQGRRLLALAKRYKLIIVHFHNHKNGYAEVDGIPLVSVGTMSAANLTAAANSLAGWNQNDARDEFGSSASGPTGAPQDRNGNVLPDEMKWSANVLSYLWFEASPTEFKIRVRQTDFCRQNSAASFAPVHVENYVGPVYEPTSEVVTFDEAPRTIAYAALDSALTGEWWTSPPTDRKGTNIGWAAYPWDQPMGVTRTLSGTSDADVRIARFPNWMQIDGTDIERIVVVDPVEDIEMAGANMTTHTYTLGAAEYVRMASASDVVDVTIECPETNGDPVLVRLGGNEASWPPGFRCTLESVDLYQIEVKGETDDQVVMVAQSHIR